MPKRMPKITDQIISIVLINKGILKVSLLNKEFQNATEDLFLRRRTLYELATITSQCFYKAYSAGGERGASSSVARGMGDGAGVVVAVGKSVGMGVLGRFL